MPMRARRTRVADLAIIKAGNEIAREIESSVLALADGSAQDFAEYRNAVGRLEGLKRALEIVKEASPKDTR